MSSHRPLKNLSAATARTRRVLLPMQRTENLLAPAQVIVSPETQLNYKIERLIGQGGFGQVFLAKRLGRSSAVPEMVCIKISTRIDGWLREAYFGQLLDSHPRAIRLYDAFPQVRSCTACLRRRRASSSADAPTYSRPRANKRV